MLNVKKVYFGEGHDFVVVGEKVGNLFKCETVSKFPEKLLIHESRLKWVSDADMKMCTDYLNKINGKEVM